MNILNVYYELIVKPIEAERNKYWIKINSKNILDILSRKQNEEYLEIYDKILLEHYNKFGHLNDEEIEFCDQINSLIDQIKKLI